MEHLRFHDLRHIFATLALQNGVDVKTYRVCSAISMRASRSAAYTHVTRQMQESAAEKMGTIAPCFIVRIAYKRCVSRLFAFCLRIVNFEKHGSK